MALKLIYYFVLILTIIYTNKADNSLESESNKLVNSVKLEISDFCDINENCSHSRVCTDNWCRCKPNHKWNEDKHRCESYNCFTEQLACKLYDPKRECRYETYYRLLGGKCECMSGYYEDRRSLKCRKFCFNNNDCDPSLSSPTSAVNGSNHMVCIDFLCQCRPNFRWNTTTMSCESFNCTKDSDCWANADENRECVDGICECNFQEDLETTKCYLSLYSLFRFKNYRTRKERLLLCTIFIIPSIALYCLLRNWRKRRINRKLKSQKTTEKMPANLSYLYVNSKK